MSSLVYLLRSLLLTSIFSFIAPLILIGGVQFGCNLLRYVPGLESFSLIANAQILFFLSQFGNGNPIEGMLIIAFTCSLVGILFDTYYTFYRY